MRGHGARLRPSKGSSAAPVPLTPIQRWFFEQGLAGAAPLQPGAVCWRCEPALEPVGCERAVQHLVAHHDALRLRFRARGRAGSSVTPTWSETVPVPAVDLSALPATEQAAALEAAAASMQASLDLASGPLLRAVLFELGAQRPGRLLLVIHHLVVDGVSWRILLEDLRARLPAAAAGRRCSCRPRRPRSRTGPSGWRGYARSEAVRAELAYWLGGPPARGAARCRVDMREGGATRGFGADAWRWRFGEEETRALLQEVPAVYHTQINDVLLTGPGAGLRPLDGARGRLLVDLEGHGREEIVRRRRPVAHGGLVHHACSRCCWSCRRRLAGGGAQGGQGAAAPGPERGLGYGLLRYLSPRPRSRGAAGPARGGGELQLPGPVRPGPVGRRSWPARESSGPPHSPEGGALICSMSTGGWPRAGCTCSGPTASGVHRRTTVERLAQGFLEALQALIVHCRSPEAGGFTPSDFPEVAVESGRA